MTQERTFDPADPHATPMHDGAPYRVERRVLAGVPALIERPPEDSEVQAICLVYHGAWAAKEGKLGVYAALASRGWAVVIPDAALHGERLAETPPDLNAREYVWESVRRTVDEAGAVMDALAGMYGPVPLFVTGSSMGGYVAQTLARTQRRVTRAAALITSGVWQEPQVRVPELRAFLDAHRPVTHAGDTPPTPLLLASGDSDPAFALAAHHVPTAAAYRAAYARAGCPEAFHEAVFPGVGHYTSRKMRDAVVEFLLKN